MPKRNIFRQGFPFDKRRDILTNWPWVCGRGVQLGIFQGENKMCYKRFVPIVLMVTLLGCAAVKEMIKPPKVSFESVNLTNFSFNQVTLDFVLSIHNPNPIGASLSGYDYVFSVEGNEFFKGDETQAITLPASGNGQMHIPVTIQFKELYSLIKTTENQDTVGYKISGHFQPAGILAGFNVPFSKSGNLPAIKRPKISLSGLKVKGLSLAKVDLELGINVDNPNIFGFDMSKLDYRIIIAGQEVATGLADQVAQVPKKGKGSITLPISLSLIGAASAVRSAIAGQAVDCAVNGSTDLSTQFGQVRLPLDLKQNVKILR